MSLIQQLTRHKSIEQLQAEVGQRRDFRRVLGLWQLTAIGLGGIIGVGIFVLAGQQAAANAGPAVALSFVLAGIASAAAALCMRNSPDSFRSPAVPTPMDTPCSARAWPG